MSGTRHGELHVLLSRVVLLHMGGTREMGGLTVTAPGASTLQSQLHVLTWEVWLWQQGESDRGIISRASRLWYSIPHPAGPLQSSGKGAGSGARAAPLVCPDRNVAHCSEASCSPPACLLSCSGPCCATPHPPFCSPWSHTPLPKEGIHACAAAFPLSTHLGAPKATTTPGQLLPSPSTGCAANLARSIVCLLFALQKPDRSWCQCPATAPSSAHR